MVFILIKKKSKIKTVWLKHQAFIASYFLGAKRSKCLGRWFPVRLPFLAY